jgi:Na+/proline symporter
MTAVAIFVYLFLLGVVSLVVARSDKSHNASNVGFFIGGRRSPWWAVSIGMVGASVSGVTFVSVPGWVTSIQFTYLQMAMGFFFGYILVAYWLLPIYYRANQVSIYAILEENLGGYGRMTAALCFLLNKILSSAVKLYVVVLVLHRLVFVDWGVPFWGVTFISLLIVWLYTYKNGIRIIVWTDMLQTVLLVVALVMLIRALIDMSNITLGDAVTIIYESPLSKIFEWDDWSDRQHFVKQFLNGVFIVLVMTGLDQDMMQKNLSCRTLKESQRNMLTYGVLFFPLNLLFLSLGLLIVWFYTKDGGDLPVTGDALLPYFAKNAGELATACFVVGMLASSFSSVDSAITSITTSLSTDFKKNEIDKKSRMVIHSLVTLLLGLIVVILQHLSNEHAIDFIYMIVVFFYGPLLGMFAFALMNKHHCKSRAIPFVALISILVTYCVKIFLMSMLRYEIGYELLLLNGGITYVGLLCVRGR